MFYRFDKIYIIFYRPTVDDRNGDKWINDKEGEDSLYICIWDIRKGI